MIGPSSDLLRFTLAAVLVSPAAVVLPPLLPVVVSLFVALGAAMTWEYFQLRRMPPLRLSRRFPGRVFVGRSAQVEVVVTNPGSTPAVVEIVDEVAAQLRAGDPAFAEVEIPAGATRSLPYEIVPAARGNHVLGPLVALRRSPRGLLERRETGGGDVIRAFPDTARFVRAQPFDVRRWFAQLGVRAAPRRGQGSELESMRDYVPGDDTRRIVWGASARRGRPVVRLDRHERNHTVWIVIDTSRLMGGAIGAQTKLDHAIDAALALACGALGSQDRVGMLAFDASVHTRMGPRRHRADLGQFVELLQPLQVKLVEPSYRTLARMLIDQLGQRALIVVLSDFGAADEESLIASLALIAKRHRVVLAGLRDPAFAALDPIDPSADDGMGIYRRIVLADLMDEREKIVGRLRRAGVDTLDVPPQQINARLLHRYLEIRYGAER